MKRDGLNRELNKALDDFLKGLAEIWARYREKDYILAEEERKSVYARLEKHQQRIDKLMERIKEV